MEFLIFLGGFLAGAIVVLISVLIINKNKNQAISDSNAIITQMQQQMALQFENTANKILKDGSNTLTEQNREKLEEFFKRFKDKIDDLEKRSLENLKAETEHFTKFDMNIKSFLETGNRISQDANSLVSVMKSDNRVAGRWGEIVLEKVLESSGLRQGEEYVVQKGIAEGRPDATIYLPDKRCVYIDSKTSFQAWEGYVNSATEEDRVQYRKQFIDSTKSHITGLAKRDYWVDDNSPDYVLMFIPIESCYSLMFCDDCVLWDFAWKHKVMPVSPSTLLAALKIINSFYIADRQNKNVLEMARLCTSVHDKFAALLTDLLKIRDSLNSTLKKLTGTGNIITQVEKLEKLGCKYEKNLPDMSEEIEEI